MLLLGRSESDLAEVSDTIRGFGGGAEALICDLLNPSSLASTAQRLGRIDILINNAGINIPEPFVSVTESHYDQIFQLNVRALFFLTQSIVDRMMAENVKGVIVNITSQMGHVGAADRTVYCAAKHAVEGFTKALAIEIAPYGIRVNAVAAGPLPSGRMGHSENRWSGPAAIAHAGALWKIVRVNAGP